MLKLPDNPQKLFKLMIAFAAVLLALLLVLSAIAIAVVNKKDEPTDEPGESRSEAESESRSEQPEPTDSMTESHTVPPDTTPRKLVAFTFDDGPHPIITKKIVDKLKEYGASASFFIVGNRLNAVNSFGLKYAIDNSCEIGLHSFTHELYYNDKCSMDQFLNDLDKTDKAIQQCVKTEIKLMRPPGGIITDDKISSCPYSVIMWNVDSEDWKYKDASTEEIRKQNVDKIVDNVMSNISEGDIVLMHELYENSYEAFCIIIERLYEQGYAVVSASELIGEGLASGKIYYSAQ